MSYEAIPSHEFGGLNLVDAPDAVGSDSIDLLNVDLDQGDAVRQRDGFDNLGTAKTDTFQQHVLAPYLSGSAWQFLASTNNGATHKVAAFDNAGALITDTGHSTTFSVVSFGSPTASVAYIGASATAIKKWNGTAFSTPAGIPTYNWLEVTPWDNRMVGANGGGSTSRVGFSNAGDPETWGADDYIHLTPGDGEDISGVAAWQELLFVFKRTRFFVFYGTSTDASGGPIFNYRPVYSGVGPQHGSEIAVGRDGVYFIDSYNGIYRTTGDQPEMVSSAISPLFRGKQIPPTYSGSAFVAGNTAGRLTWHDERLYFATQTGASAYNNRTFVYDPRRDYWLEQDIPAMTMASAPLSASGRNELIFAYATGGNFLGRHSSAYTTDDGVAITSRYRHGFTDLGIEAEKTIRETLLWGIGTVGVALSRDFGALDSATSVTLGTAPAIAGGRMRKAKRGTTFSHQLSSVSGGAWTVHRLTHHVRESRSVGIKTAA